MIGVDVLYESLTDLSARVRGRRLSPVELTQACLDRIRQLSPTFNAFETVTADQALMQARMAEGEIGRGRWRGPLHGIPWGAKDLFATAGIRTTWGAVPLREQVFDYDATVVSRLREAGAVLLGKCAMIELAGGLGYRFANASVSGPGRNPWDTTRWTGGSSSGSAAAVAAGLAPFALGTETWGSILCPSAFCGLTGLRPTYGRVSRAGAMACSWSFDKVGPLARSASDCRLVLKVIAGRDPADSTSSSEPVELKPRRIDPRRIRVALVPMDFSVKGAEPEVKSAFSAAVAELRSAGLEIVEAKLPDIPAAEAAGLLITDEALSSFEDLFRDGRVRQLKDPYAPYQLEINAAVTGADLMKAWRIRRALQQSMADFFADYDVIVTPNFLSVAPKIEDDLYRALPYADPVGAIGNACGLPAIALPCGFGRDHMPAGFQIMGPPFSEGLLLDLGDLYQRRTSWHLERPALAEEGVAR
ncbi:MAG TPA: amidase [Terriglobales bacterium]|nr:amidase [Terriglobales bacterium]